MDEKDYRLKVKAVYARVESAFNDIDPDLAEVELGAGTLTISSGGKKTILSTQPSVRQIWLALAALGRAVHFSWSDERKAWLDDKDPQVELYSFLESLMPQLIGQKLKI